MRSIEELEFLFQKIGTKNAKEWAFVEYNERLGNLASLAFLKELQSRIPLKGDKFWLGRWADYESSRYPEAYDSLKRLIESGADLGDLNALVRGVLSFFIGEVATALDHGEPNDLNDDLASKIQWRFCEVTESNVLKSVSGLHELVESGD